MADMKVRVERDGPVGRLVLDDGKVNSYDHSFMHDLNAAIDAARREPSIRVVVVHSESPKGLFSAGADIRAFLANSVEQNLAMIELAHEALRKMAKSEKLFIAAIGGGAYGGGLEIALACDFRVAGDGDYQMGLPEVTLGLLPGNGGTVRLPRLIGYQQALEMMITGRTVGPAAAHEMGIVDRLFPQDTYLEDAISWANEIAGKATLAIGHIKRSVMEGMQAPLDVAFAAERALVAELFHSEDAKEGLTAFTERRPPSFKGR